LKEAEGVPESMQSLHEKMKAADGLIVSAAEHNGSMAAVLKNTFDWLSMLEQKFFLNKPTVFLSTSPGPRGASSSLKHLVEIMPFRGANIVGHFSLPSFYDNVKEGAVNSRFHAEILTLIRKLEETVNE
jgi:NAD(P)H-dependent FMN reductase